MVNLLKPGKFYRNIAKIRGGFLVHKKHPDLNKKFTLDQFDQYATIFDDDLVLIVENLGEKICTPSKNKYITYKILTKDCVGYIFVYNNASRNWVEVTSC